MRRGQGPQTRELEGQPKGEGAPENFLDESILHFIAHLFLFLSLPSPSFLFFCLHTWLNSTYDSTYPLGRAKDRQVSCLAESIPGEPPSHLITFSFSGHKSSPGKQCVACSTLWSDAEDIFRV